MTQQEALYYQLALLIACHGRKQIVTSLSKVIKLPEVELESLLSSVEESKAHPGAGRSRGQQSSIESVISQHPKKADQLQTLTSRLQDKTFLPELRDVRRFLEEHGRDASGLKSRAAALLPLVTVLSQLEPTELSDLLEQPDASEYSSLGVISDQILGRSHR